MTTTTSPPNLHSHLHAFNHHTGRPRFHFDEASDAAAAATAAAKPWHDGAPPEVLGFWQNKGLPLDNPRDFGTKLTELYRQAEKFIGVPPDQVVKIPKADAPPEDLRAYYERLGAPKEAKDYDLSAIKDAGLADTLRNAMHARGTPKDAASDLAKAVATALESQKTAQATIDAANLAEQLGKLEQNWGGKDSAAYRLNQLNAMEGARRLGISPEAVKALEGQIGYPAVMEAMRKIGTNTREDTFVERGAGGTGEVTTVEGAVARKAELMADPAWRTRFLQNGQAEVREMTRLDTMIAGV